ncbi:RDD family protein [Bdellovibrio sp. KM01]|uniref:RDD family protein n=1 Tax=Bdellovibrio sp. KM01 TaxID=2748865 RepID=UPI0021057122|nr:RDD family protein [Bdellovibrio sp. KM01]
MMTKATENTADIYVPSTWKRLLAVTIDQVFLAICYSPFYKAFYTVWFTDADVQFNLFQLLMLFLTPALYEAASLMLISATPGKWIMGLKVVPAHSPHEELDYTQCLLRPLTSRLSFFFSWAIFALAFFRYDRTHLSDWVAETRVVQFQPRSTRAGIRWVLGFFLVLSYSYEGLHYAAGILNEINWQEGKADLRDLLVVGGMDDMQLDFDMDDEGE